MPAIAASLPKIQILSRLQTPKLRSAYRGSICRAEADNNNASAGACKVKFSVTQHVEFGQQVEVTGKKRALYGDPMTCRLT
jgi:hypothetical protein